MMATLTFDDVAKTFTMHLQGGTRIGVLEGVCFTLAPGECVVLTGSSGAGKSTILKLAYGNYRADRGRIIVRDGPHEVDIAAAVPRQVIAARRERIGYVSQFLSVIPRVSAEDLVMQKARQAGRTDPRAIAQALLSRLNLKERLWSLPPATFSGGEQQRVNIAMSLVGRHPILLLDEPTAALDTENRKVVIALVREKLAAGCAVLAIFHDEEVRDALATRRLDVSTFAPNPAISD
ncbi:MAG: phosphonate C-P lyase system protein PhnL [Pseudomonadota bacterium]